VITPHRVTPETVRQILHDPPDFIEYSYLPAWRAGRFTTEDLAYAVTAALEQSPYNDGDVDAVLEIMIDMGYGEETKSAVWV